MKAHCLRAYQPAHPVKLCKMGRKRAQQRRSGLFRRIAEHVRATLGDALWADFVAHAISALRKPILRFVPPPHGGACPHHFRVDVTCARAYTTLARRAAPGPRVGRGRDVRHLWVQALSQRSRARAHTDRTTGGSHRGQPVSHVSRSCQTHSVRRYLNSHPKVHLQPTRTELEMCPVRCACSIGGLDSRHGATPSPQE